MKTLAIIIIIIILVGLSFFTTMSKVNEKMDDKYVFVVRSIFYWLAILIAFCFGHFI